MGNCTSKKSGKLSKISLPKLPVKKMDKENIVNKPVLSAKIAPTTKGQATSFGFKRKTASALPTPVTLTSRVNEMRQDGQSGSSIESLCHVPSTSSPIVTPKTVAKPSPKGSSGQTRTSPGSSTGSGPGAANRFGFRSSTPPRSAGKSPGPSATPRRSPNSRSKSAGPREAREAFFREVMQPAGSANSFLGSQSHILHEPNPGKFYFQTSLLPRPQFPVRLSDKTYKTVANYCRRDGSVEASSSREQSVTEDSGVGSQQNFNTLGETDTLHNLELSDSSPAPPSTKGRPARKLELRMVNPNKFELLDKGGLRQPATGSNKPMRSPISTGLVQQRAEEYLQRLAGVKDSNRIRQINGRSTTSPSEETESEEEKLKRDARKNEKSGGVSYLMTEGSGENDEFLPGEAMADEITLSFSSDDEISSVGRAIGPVEPKPIRPSANQVLGVAIRSDALKLSNQLKRGDSPDGNNKEMDDSCYGLLSGEDKVPLEDETLLELSTESDSLCDKDENKEDTKINTSTESPGTPSNTSLSEGRDFLIDDEIADQPQLCFSTHEDLVDKPLQVSSGNNNGSETAPIKGPTDQLAMKEDRVRRVSVGTLSPCESLMSDDLIMDFDTSAAEEEVERCDNGDNSSDALFDSLSFADLGSSQDVRLKQWASLPRTKSHIGVNGKKSGSSGSSPASHRSGVSRASTEEDLSIRLDKSSYQLMFQDIVSIKSMLLKLHKLLSESDGSLGPYTEEDMAIDLKKQVAFLQQQLQQRETSLQNLQTEVNRNVDHRTKSNGIAPTLCNAATQTDRVRPVSTGPSIVNNLPSDSNNVVTNGSRKVADWMENNEKHKNNNKIVKMGPADKIMEKVKELSFKPVEVMERERSMKKVFKITKIDLVLKSDNFGQSELRKS